MECHVACNPYDRAYAEIVIFKSLGFRLKIAEQV